MKGNVRIETVPAEEIQKCIASYEPQKDYKLGSYIDANDGIAWRAAVVTKCGEGTISIHYEGWGPKFDEADIKLPSSKLAPFRRMSAGYTGQLKQAYREFKYSVTEKKHVEEELKKIIDAGFVIDDPVKYTQFVRGEAFFYVDSLLTMLHIGPPEPAAMREILAFLKFFLHFVVEWLKAAADLSQEFDAAEKWDMLYLVHARTTVAATHSEISELLGEFFGLCRRTLPVFKVRLRLSHSGGL